MKFFILHFTILFTAFMSHSSYSNKTISKTSPLVFAHRASSGLWIQNTRHAVINTVKLFQQPPILFHGIEIDLVLSKDNQLVLSHDPWINKKLCRDNAGKIIKEVLIRTLTLDEIQKNYLCGGIIDTDFPHAELNQENIMSFQEFLSVVKKEPTLHVYLDLKLQEPLTKGAKEYAQSIAKTWQQSGAKNTLFIEGPTKEVINTYKKYIDNKFFSILSYPPFLTGENWTITGAKQALITFFTPRKPLEKANEAKAEGIASHTMIINQRAIKLLTQAKKNIVVFTPNNKKQMAAACESGADIIITDFPTLGPCK